MKKINKSKIDWPFPNLHCWHPVIGCPRNCFDGKCWAMAVNKRLINIEDQTGVQMSGWIEDFSKPELIEAELNRPFPGKPSTIFVGSRSDCEFWEDDWWDKIGERIHKDGKKHEFLFLSKDPNTYDYIDLPKNCTLGLTVTFKDPERDLASITELYELNNDYNRLFLSIEPLLGSVPYLAKAFVDRFHQVICGAMNQGNKPTKEMIESAQKYLPSDTWWKKNIRRFM